MKKVTITKKITNIENLRNELCTMYEQLRTGDIGLSEAKQAANVAGKIISSVKTEMEYNKMIQSKDTIPFMNN